tara:strand:+ start:198 stop:668 length:471 start_codon:yes stop_codon:yes gene_type:complete
MILKKELQDRIEELEKEVKHLEDSRDALTKRIDQIVDSKGEVERKLFEAQQLIEHEKVTGPLYQICDPSNRWYHMNRDLGIDIYFEDYTSPKKLLTRIPVNPASEHEIPKEVLLDRLTKAQAALMNLYRGDSSSEMINVDITFGSIMWTENLEEEY